MIVLYLACFAITVLCRILCTVLSPIAAALLSSTEASVTLHYTATSGCPGDHLVFACLTTNTLLLRWLFVDTGEELTFIAANNVTEQPLPVDENGIRTVIVANLTSKTCHPNDSCSMESLIVIPIWPDGVNLTLELLCQSSDHDSKKIVVTRNGEYNAYVHVCIQCTILHSC